MTKKIATWMFTLGVITCWFLFILFHTGRMGE